MRLQILTYARLHLLRRDINLYGRLQGPITLAPIAKRLAVEPSLPILTTQVYRGWDRTPNLLLVGLYN